MARVACLFLQRLLVYGPGTMLWAVTGSSMAGFWWSIALTPRNGVAIMQHQFQVLHLLIFYEECSALGLAS